MMHFPARVIIDYHADLLYNFSLYSSDLNKTGFTFQINMLQHNKTTAAKNREIRYQQAQEITNGVKYSEELNVE